MKTLKIALVLAMGLILTAESCAQKQTPKGMTTAQVDSLSYAIGVMMGSNFKESKLTYLDMSEFTKAVNDVFGDKKLKIDAAQAQMIIQNHFMQMQQAEQEEMAAQAAVNKEEGLKFLAENKTKEGVVELPSGLQYQIITEGTGVKPAETDTVEVHYRGTLIDGTEFDSSYERGETAKFPLNRVIKGWTEGLQLIGEGAKVMLYIPSNLAYGEQNTGGKIKPNSTLIFEVEMIKVSKAKPEAAKPAKK